MRSNGSRLLLMGLALGLMALSGCQGIGRSFNPLAPYGSPRIPSPGTNSYQTGAPAGTVVSPSATQGANAGVGTTQQVEQVPATTGDAYYSGAQTTTGPASYGSGTITGVGVQGRTENPGYLPAHGVNAASASMNASVQQLSPNSSSMYGGVGNTNSFVPTATPSTTTPSTTTPSTTATPVSNRSAGWVRSNRAGASTSGYGTGNSGGTGAGGSGSNGTATPQAIPNSPSVPGRFVPMTSTQPIGTGVASNGGGQPVGAIPSSYEQAAAEWASYIRQAGSSQYANQAVSGEVAQASVSGPSRNAGMQVHDATGAHSAAVQMIPVPSRSNSLLPNYVAATTLPQSVGESTATEAGAAGDWESR